MPIADRMPMIAITISNSMSVKHLQSYELNAWPFPLMAGNEVML